jgi:hypothetical protein
VSLCMHWSKSCSPLDSQHPVNSITTHISHQPCHRRRLACAMSNVLPRSYMRLVPVSPLPR